MFFKSKKISKLEDEIKGLKNDLKDMDEGYRRCVELLTDHLKTMDEDYKKGVEMLTDQVVFLNSYCMCLSESSATLCDQLGVSWVDILKETTRKLVKLPTDSVESEYGMMGLKKEDLN